MLPALQMKPIKLKWRVPVPIIILNPVKKRRKFSLICPKSLCLSRRRSWKRHYKPWTTQEPVKTSGRWGININIIYSNSSYKPTSSVHQSKVTAAQISWIHNTTCSALWSRKWGFVYICCARESTTAPASEVQRENVFTSARAQFLSRKAIFKMPPRRIPPVTAWIHVLAYLVGLQPQRRRIPLLQCCSSGSTSSNGVWSAWPRAFYTATWIGTCGY